MRHNFPKHRYKYGKLTKGIELKDFNRILSRVDEVNIGGYSSLLIKSFLALLYWSGLRKTEICGARPHMYTLKSCRKHMEPIVKYTERIAGILKEDMKIEGDTLYIKAVARKHGHREGQLELYTGFPFVNLIIDQWSITQPKQRVFPISEYDSWLIMNRINPKMYLHFLRFNRITEMCSNPELSIAEICSWTGLNPRTINDYMERSQRFIHSTAEKMRKKEFPYGTSAIPIGLSMIPEANK